MMEARFQYYYWTKIYLQHVSAALIISFFWPWLPPLLHCLDRQKEGLITLYHLQVWLFLMPSNQHCPSVSLLAWPWLPPPLLRCLDLQNEGLITLYHLQVRLFLMLSNQHCPSVSLLSWASYDNLFFLLLYELAVVLDCVIGPIWYTLCSDKNKSCSALCTKVCRKTIQKKGEKILTHLSIKTYFWPSIALFAGLRY